MPTNTLAQIVAIRGPRTIKVESGSGARHRDRRSEQKRHPSSSYRALKPMFGRQQSLHRDGDAARCYGGFDADSRADEQQDYAI
jgi:hypothetical protein